MTTRWDKTCAEAFEQRPAGADHTSIPCIVPASRDASRSYVKGIEVRVRVRVRVRVMVRVEDEGCGMWGKTTVWGDGEE